MKFKLDIENVIMILFISIVALLTVACHSFYDNQKSHVKEPTFYSMTGEAYINHGN